MNASETEMEARGGTEGREGGARREGSGREEEGREMEGRKGGGREERGNGCRKERSCGKKEGVVRGCGGSVREQERKK